MTLLAQSETQDERLMEGFVINKIEMYKFMRYRQKTTIPFTYQFTVICGQTGHGKTTILDAITFALYRRTSRTDLKGVNIEDICDYSGYTKITFSHKGSTYSVKRGRDRTGKSTLTLEQDGQRIAGTIPELDAKIEAIIGLDYLGFRNSTFIRQDEMKSLGSEIGSKRLEIFQKLFRLELFEKAQSLADQNQRITREHISKLQGMIESEKQQILKLSELRKEKINLEQEMQTIRPQLNAITIKLNTTETRRIELQKKHDEFIKLRGLSGEREEEINQLVKRLETTEKSQDQIKHLQTQIEDLEKETYDYESLFDQVKTLSIRLTEQAQKYKSLLEQKTQYEQNASDLTKKYEESMINLSKRLSKHENRVLDLKKTVIDKDTAFEILRTEGMLNERISRIEKEINWLSDNISLVQALKKEQLQAKSQLSEIQTKTQLINQDSFVLSEIQTQITQLKKDLDKIEAEYAQELLHIQNKIREKNEAIKTLGYQEEDWVNLHKLEQVMKEKRVKRGVLEKKRNELKKLGDQAALVVALTQELQQKRHNFNQIKDNIEILQPFEMEFKQIQEMILTLYDQKEKIQTEVAEKTGMLKKITDNIVSLEELAGIIQEKEAQLTELQSTAEIFTILKENVFHKIGVPMYAIQQLLPQLSREASMNLSDLTDKRFTQMKLTTYDEGGSYGIKIEVAGAANRWMDVQEFSGGEKTQINGALRLAIAKELARMPQIGKTYGQMRTLFIDEGDLGSLDTEISRTLFIKKLFEQGKFFRKVTLITHLTDLIELFPGKIRVYMTPTGESRVDIGEASEK
ncbi:MAG: AAA family ATPase [Candidatus Heimdallarchaeota archaeon]